jgi:hypothetical protein
MNSVWLLLKHYDQEGEEVEAIYASEELANKGKENYSLNNPNFSGDLWVIKWGVINDRI